MKKVLLLITLLTLAVGIHAQAKPKYTYAAQRKLIPTDLGQVYLGMPLKAFAAKIDISRAEANDRFEWLELDIPFAKGNVTSLAIRVHGLSTEEKAAILHEVSVKRKSEDGEEYETEVKQPKPGAVIPVKAFVYSIFVGFKKDFDLNKYLVGQYGKGTERKADDPYYFYDTEWTKKTTDGLVTLIRAYHKADNKSLQLLGRIDGTEWDPGV